MRLGISYALSYENAEIWADLHRKCGCRTVVFPLDCHADEKTIEAYAKAAREADLTIAEVGVWRNMLSSNSKVREEVFEYTVGQIRMADSIGARCVVNVAGRPRVIVGTVAIGRISPTKPENRPSRPFKRSSTPRSRRRRSSPSSPCRG